MFRNAFATVLLGLRVNAELGTYLVPDNLVEEIVKSLCGHFAIERHVVSLVPGDLLADTDDLQRKS